MSSFLRYCCVKCKTEYRAKDYNRHIKSSYHITYTDDKKEQQRLEKNKKRMERYYANKDNECKKHNCLCGGKYTYVNKSTHEKTKKHQDYFYD